MMSSDETSDYLNNLGGSGGNKEQSYLDSVNEKGGIVETPTEDYLNTLSTPGSGTGVGNYLNDLTVNAGSSIIYLIIIVQSIVAVACIFALDASCGLPFLLGQLISASSEIR